MPNYQEKFFIVKGEKEKRRFYTSAANGPWIRDREAALHWPTHAEAQAVLDGWEAPGEAYVLRGLENA